jgi:hypothetical protein
MKRHPLYLTSRRSSPSLLYDHIRAIARKPRPRALGSAESISAISFVFTYVIDTSIWWRLTQTASKNIKLLIFYWIFMESLTIHDWELPAHYHDYILRTTQRIELKLCMKIHICWLYYKKSFQMKQFVVRFLQIPPEGEKYLFWPALWPHI